MEPPISSASFVGTISAQINLRAPFATAEFRERNDDHRKGEADEKVPRGLPELQASEGKGT